MPEHLHIVALDAPAPPDYGGVFDLYYKVPALAKKGYNIHLHYFSYKQGRSANGLEPYCVSINSYKRAPFLISLFTFRPYIVGSRIKKELISNLNIDKAPVLLEGIHCAGLIPHIRKDKKIILRLHNDEAIYYKSLFYADNNIFRKLYFGYEYVALEKFQNRINKNILIVGVSTSDLEIFKNKYNFKNLRFIPCFLPWQTVVSQVGRGSYCLYQGNMEVSENIQAVKWLQENVFASLKLPLIIAGKNARALPDKLSISHNTQIVSDPTDQQLSELIQNAHINILPSLNKTGVKLKLLHALYEGRFCISNNNGIQGSGIRNGVYIADTSEDMISLITSLFEKAFTQQDIILRKQVLELYNNELNADRLIAIL